MRLTTDSAIQTALGRLPKEEVVELTRRLIRIPSVNPPGGEGPVAEHLALLLEREGITCELQEVEPGRPNLIASIGTGKSPHLAFNGHIDVVGAGERANWSVDPFAGELRDNRIIGRGACDMKGGIAALTCAFLAIHRAKIPLAGTLSYTAVMGEETGSVGAGHLLQSGFTADAAIVGECSTAEQIGIGYRGALWFEVTTHGRTSHGSRPHLGINAILQMTDLVIPTLRNVVNEMPHVEHTEFLIKKPTLNVGMISGGFKVNVVPDACSATFDLRIVPGQSSGEVLKAVQQALRGLAEHHSDFRWDLKVIKQIEPFITDPNSRLVQSLTAACQRTNGALPKCVGKTGYSDANAFAGRLGISAVAFGPGAIGSGHSPDEWVDIDDLYKVAQIYVATAIDYCGLGASD